jgi:hypothetical protein
MKKPGARVPNTTDKKFLAFGTGTLAIEITL